MFYLIGTGINDYKDIPLRGLEYCRKSGHVFIERYTGITEDIDGFEKLFGRKIIELSRAELEQDFERIVLARAESEDVILLVPGDPLTATTHIEFLKSCKENNVKYKVVHASSVYSSVCETGLHVYKFGKSCSIPYSEANYKPTSFFDIIEENHKNKAHTLVFLDIKQDEKKYMSIKQGLRILLDISKQRKSFFNGDTGVIGIARLGGDNQIIKYGSVNELLKHGFGPNPHALIIPSMNEIEKEYVKFLYK